MEDSLESEVVLIVPPSIEDSDPSMIGSDGPLGIATRPLGSSDASFSCFQLSGRGIESRSESSESLHIDNGGGDVIPSSPGVMHIDLATTPTKELNVPISAITVAQDFCTTSDVDSVRMSPELIPSSDVSSFDMMSSNPISHGSSSLKDDHPAQDSDEEKPLPPIVNPFDDIDTETYSPSKYLRTPEKDQEQAPSSYTFLQKIASAVSQPTPVLEADSENQAKEEEKSLRKPEEFDIDSEEIMIKDVEMRSVEESNSPKLQIKNAESNPPSPPEVEGAQTYTQDLNLHLTFESQLFGASSLQSADSQTLVIDEQSQSINPTASLLDEPCKTCGLDDQNNGKSEDSCSAEQNNGRNGDSPSRGNDNDRIICQEAASSQPDSQLMYGAEFENGGIASKLGNLSCEAEEVTSKNLSKDDLLKNSTVSLSLGVSPTKEPESISEGLMLEGTFAPSVSASYLVEGSSGSEGSQSLTNGTLLSSQSPSTALEVKSHSDKAELTTVETAKDLNEVSPSMQSTYVDENRSQAESQPANATNDQSSEPIASSQTATSYDASVENSSLESVTDLIGLPLGDMETQPYSLSAREETMEVESSYQDSQSRENLTTSITDNEIRYLVDELVNQALVQTSNDQAPAAEATVDIAELLGSKGEGESAEVERKINDKDQPSQDIAVKSPFRSPSEPPVRERSASRRGRRSGRQRSKKQMDKYLKNDAHNNNEIAQNEEHDKSSDTLPPDEGSGQDSDPLPSPAKENQLTYRVTKTTVVETMCNGKVIDVRTLPKKVKICATSPYQLTSSQSSNGSGYLADTSSISRTSSDSSTQTTSSHSPGCQQIHTSVPSLPRDSSGSSTTSSLSTSSALVIHGQAMKTVKSQKRSKHQPSTSSPSEKASPACVPASSPQSESTTPSQSFHKSPPLKKSIVLLTPLSEELIAASTGTMGSNCCGNIATPPTTNINPPLSGSTPVEMPQKDSLSEVETSNSPEIPCPDNSVRGTVFKVKKSPTGSTKNTPKKSPGKKETTDMVSFGEGIPVMARIPTETYFYPGMMRSQDPSSGKYSVFFEDDQKERMIRESDVLLIDKLNVGQEVFVQSDSDDPSHWYSAGKILSYWRENDERGYVIERLDAALNTKKGRRYSRKSVIVRQEHLTDEQKSCRVQPPSMAMYDVSLDNIVDGKRRTRRSRFNSPATSSPSSSKPGTPSPSSSKTPKSSRKRRISDSQSSGSSSSVPFPSIKKPKRAKLTYGAKTPSKKRSSPAAKAQAVYKESQIFENCIFLLTSTTGRDQPSSEFDSPPYETTNGYDKVDIRRKIVSGSGKVAKSFAELMSSDRDHRYVVADNFCRTVNYLSALGAGIECLSHLFIDHSLNVGKLKKSDAYKLPAGYSLQQRSVVERPSMHSQPLSGLRIHLQMKDIATWSPLLILAGCETVSSRQNTMKDECSLTCDVVIADASCTSALKNRAKLLNIPVVSIEWVIQCLITGEKLPFYGHQQYTVFE